MRRCRTQRDNIIFGTRHRQVSFSSPPDTEPLQNASPFIPPPTSYPIFSPHHRYVTPSRGNLRLPNPQWANDPLAPAANPFTPRPRANSTPWNPPPSFQSRHQPQSPWAPPPPTPTQSYFGHYTPATTPGRAMTGLPVGEPDLQQWNFSAGTLSWTPHPAPHPGVSPGTFWGTQLPPLAMGQSPWHAVTTPLDPWTAACLTGGWPLPGTAPAWNLGAWPVQLVPIRLAPCLIPNPANANVPQLVWDISQNPARSQRITGAHTIVPLTSQFSQQAIVPAVNEVQITVSESLLQEYWGRIKITSSSKITVWDILSGIYEYFQMPLTQHEVDTLQSLEPDNYNLLVRACQARCNVTPALPGFEQLQGLKRVDMLGDTRAFWGLWISIDEAKNTFHLNLGLRDIPPSRI